MTHVKFILEDGSPVGYVAEGHSGAGTRGNDVVCAAVSTLLQALELGMLEVLKVDGPKYEVDPRVPMRMMIWGRLEGEGPRVLLDTVRISLQSLASAHPSHIAISEVERRELRF
ncbi:ribosomal-processing cysteine protease Prp [Thermanaerovibrio acidaminovorans]|jgi:hypothetical protein|uniref:Ribosomal processing cysteine protease Prp n=1 Tax=Thermanaerovibrio acidaminovorans (strain ATCC 49978 / DSM 6589 / Su883) TaxID=525903 RepID=D1BA27_THEAS|nr:ribosomal-processing cysteine protease Prp [Thermanaerovibrio acidaminovorans]ACZ19130.1 protein of unknown function DUF464 [Thermanaerovibrio acidaminovorans DSM 6589]